MQPISIKLWRAPRLWWNFTAFSRCRMEENLFVWAKILQTWNIQFVAEVSCMKYMESCYGHSSHLCPHSSSGHRNFYMQVLHNLISWQPHIRKHSSWECTLQTLLLTTGGTISDWCCLKQFLPYFYLWKYSGILAEQI